MRFEGRNFHPNSAEISATEKRMTARRALEALRYRKSRGATEYGPRVEDPSDPTETLASEAAPWGRGGAEVRREQTESALQRAAARAAKLLTGWR